MAMLPFIGYNAGDYFAHWIEVGKSADAVKLPKIFYVNWFRRDAEGKFVWPGFGENIRVLKWALERIEGKAAAIDTPIGRVPTPEALDTAGLDMSAEDLAQRADRGRRASGSASSPLIEEWFDKIGDVAAVVDARRAGLAQAAAAGEPVTSSPCPAGRRFVAPPATRRGAKGAPPAGDVPRPLQQPGAALSLLPAGDVPRPLQQPGAGQSQHFSPLGNVPWPLQQPGAGQSAAVAGSSILAPVAYGKPVAMRA